jgi:hypothetical protein
VIPADSRAVLTSLPAGTEAVRNCPSASIWTEISSRGVAGGGEEEQADPARRRIQAASTTLIKWYNLMIEICILLTQLRGSKNLHIHSNSRL